MAQKCPKDVDRAAEYVMRHARFYGYGYQQPQAAPQTRQAPAAQELGARQERHMSLSSISGGEAPEPLSLETLNKMSDADFHAMARKLGDKGLDSLMGAA